MVRGNDGEEPDFPRKAPKEAAATYVLLCKHYGTKSLQALKEPDSLRASVRTGCMAGCAAGLGRPGQAGTRRSVRGKRSRHGLRESRLAASFARPIPSPAT
ncbi:hypothetical protein KIH86_13475 [Paenibacillus sp. HN-1]|uniref:hypothetical protein n=1 Tax=Paenibacillus TaxID=44249 RepID=UPI001CA9D243|nr:MULTISPECIES: hypothetical protein [Paenibacillus]MBY9080770.1 hypothetical protein [Paenibacillus sp. CGMCC 1.18879]MBY9085238.1 hypothetical protein [Paenibacillus sinensis]